MIAAYKAGIPGNGGKFPDGSKSAKIQWTPKKSAEAPFSVNVPDTLKNVFLVEKDSGRDFRPAADGDTPCSTMMRRPTRSRLTGAAADCGHACHTAVAAKDYIFHPYQNR